MQSKIKNLIETRLDPEKFADSLNCQILKPWIIQQYNKGHQSKSDYKTIINWYNNNNPTIEKYTFHDALKTAQKYINSLKKNSGFDKNVNINSENHELEFDDGKYWNIIAPEDCNNIIHRLNYDCSQELKPVLDNETQGWALFDSQDNLLCIAINNNNKLLIIGQLGKIPNRPTEINKLCIKKGFKPTPECYNNQQLPNALLKGLIDIRDIEDYRPLMKRLDIKSIIDCKLLNLAHYCSLSTILELYIKTRKQCLLQYIICACICQNLTKSEIYNKAKQYLNNHPDLISKINKIKGNDTRPYYDLLEKAQTEISEL